MFTEVLKGVNTIAIHDLWQIFDDGWTCIRIGEISGSNSNRRGPAIIISMAASAESTPPIPIIGSLVD